MNNCYHLRMATIKKISIALPDEMVAMLRDCVKKGEYSSASEIIREALRNWKLKRKIETAELKELRAMIREGMESGPGLDANKVFSSLRKKYAK